MNKKTARQRLKLLFKDLEKLAADPSANTPEISSQIELLRARVVELEKYLTEDLEVGTGKNGKEAPSLNASLEEQQTSTPKFSLYEKDKIGYVFANDKMDVIQSESDLSDAITSELQAGGQTIGAMKFKPPTDKPLTHEDLNLANSVAQQVSLQIQNLRLLADAERSRAEAETATRRFMHEGWDNYLDAINRHERIGYAYDQSAVTPFPSKIKGNGGIRKAIKLLEEEIGTLYVEAEPNKQVSNADQELIDLVTNQVAQQVENIRLLADAARARAEAEDAIKRLTHENWETYQSGDENRKLGFIYDTVEVSPVKDDTFPDNIVYSQPLLVRGEVVGNLHVGGNKEISPENAQLAATIANQASLHLETLRLSEELQRRAKELEELDRLKSGFLANMSHELRTPLNSILGFSDVILEGLNGPLSANMDNDIRLIQKNGQHLLHLINDVLDMAKIESGRMNLHPEKFLLHSVLEEVNSITSTLASEKNVSLYIEEDSESDIEVYADNTRLRQVMINLVNNSIKFTEKGYIRIKTKRIDGGRVLITVQDSGIGIPPENLESIFQEFTQVDTSTTRKVGGTGLGLPISRRLVEMHGGRLWAESLGIEGEGSTFFVELPLEARITEVIEKQEK